MTENGITENNIIMIGPQGSGKGTQAKRLSRKLGVPEISTGDIFREMRTQDSELGKKVKGLIDSGQLVPVYVWPTTERVSTHIESDVQHSIDIAGSMQPIDCEANNCGGHGDCGCRFARVVGDGLPRFVQRELPARL